MDVKKRLVSYFEAVGDVLRGNAETAKIFRNPADVGSTREEIFSEFLRNHLPAWCNVERGGFLFNWQGEESGQLDIIVSSGYAPKFVPNPADGKTIREVEGVLGVISIKSTLDSRATKDALLGFSKIPQMKTGHAHVNPMLKNVKMEDFIFLQVYASNTDNIDAVFKWVHEFYEGRPEIPMNRRPDLIHVNSKGVIIKAKPGSVYGEETLEAGRYYLLEGTSNFYGLSSTVDEIRRRVAMLPSILFQLSDLPVLLSESFEPGEGKWQLIELRRM